MASVIQLTSVRNQDQQHSLVQTGTEYGIFVRFTQTRFKVCFSPVRLVVACRNSHMWNET